MDESLNSQKEPATGEITTLDRILPPGACRVVAVTAAGGFRRRLLALGFIPGTPIEAVRVAPLGDPVEYKIKSYHLSLRKEDARFITVTRDEGRT